MNVDLGGFAGLAVAILGGAAVGVERQRSGHATGPDARLGGIRTFTLLGTLAGIAGMLIESGQPIPASLLLAGGIAVIVAGYIRASSKDIDATTEVAAIVVLGAGALGGLGFLRLSAALTTLTVLLLAEKPRLHGFVERLDEPTMLAAARFAVMSIVILPLLPEGPFGPGPGIKPRELWMLVLLFSGMSFVGYIAQRMSGAAGYPLTGLLGGLVSSTSVTLTFARLSKAHPQQEGPLAVGAVAASTVLFFRVAIAVAVLNAALLPVLARYLAGPFIVAVDRRCHGVAIAGRIGGRREGVEESAATAERDRNGAALSGGAVRRVLHARSGWVIRACSSAASCSASPTSMRSRCR